MKKVFNFITGISKIILSIINIFLIVIIVLNILLLLSEKVLKNTYPTILDYTYFISRENISNLNIEEGSLLLVDTRTSSDPSDIIVYKENNELKYAKVLESDNYSATTSSNKKIDNENIIGIVILNIKNLGSLVNKILSINSLIISIIILIITSVIQSLLNKKRHKDNQVKPNFDQMQNI